MSVALGTLKDELQLFQTSAASVQFEKCSEICTLYDATVGEMEQIHFSKFNKTQLFDSTILEVTVKIQLRNNVMPCGN